MAGLAHSHRPRLGQNLVRIVLDQRTGDDQHLSHRAMTSDGYVGDSSPDRLDALVWAISDLMLGATITPTRWVHIDFMGR
jgi:hypothetical protein